jgi:hypothetical protein
MISLEEADKLVDAGAAEWDGWTLILFRPGSAPVASKRALWRNGKWRLADRYEIDRNGEYSVSRNALKALRHQR